VLAATPVAPTSPLHPNRQTQRKTGEETTSRRKRGRNRTTGKKKEQGAGRKLEDRSFAQRLPIRAKSLQNQVSPSFSPLCKFSFICNCAKVI
jgi:hypothetical protein